LREELSHGDFAQQIGFPHSVLQFCPKNKREECQKQAALRILVDSGSKTTLVVFVLSESKSFSA